MATRHERHIWPSASGTKVLSKKLKSLIKEMKENGLVDRRGDSLMNSYVEWVYGCWKNKWSTHEVKTRPE